MKTPNRLMLNAVSNCLRLGISIGTLFLLTPFILKKVGETDFGLWSLTFSVLGIFGLLDFGCSTGVVKFVASSNGSGDTSLRNRLVSSLLVVYAGLTIAAAISIGILSQFFADAFSIPLEEQNKAAALLWILAVRTVILGFPLSLFKGILFGEQRIYLINAVQTVTSILYGLSAWYLLEQGAGVVGLAVINLGIFLIEHAMYAWLAYKYSQELHIGWSLVDRKLFGEIFSFSAFAFVPQVAALILLKTDPILVSVFLPLSAVAIYAIALKVTENLHLLLKQFVNILTPIAAEMSGRKDGQGIRQLLLQGTKFSFAPAVVISGCIVVYGEQAVTLWVGSSFLAAVPVLIILSLASALSIPQLVASTALTMTGHQKYTAGTAVIAAVLNVGFSLSLAPGLGLVGIALGTLISVLLVDIVLVLKEACRRFGVSYSAYIIEAIFPSVLPGVGLLLITYQLRWLWEPSTFLHLALQGLAGSAVFALLFWSFSLKANERAFLIARIPIRQRFRYWQRVKEAWL